MITGKTNTGFSFEIEEDARDDMELLETIAELDDGNMNHIPKVLKMLLGEKQKKSLYEHCRKENGRVSAAQVFEELKTIFEEAQKEDTGLKN